MTFRDALRTHLDAIQSRDLSGLMETVSPDDLTLVASDGRIVRTASEFETMHREWFASPTWTLGVELVRTIESPVQASATLLLDYRDAPPGGAPVRQESVLTLVFILRDGRWLMALDQNTPIVGGFTSR